MAAVSRTERARRRLKPTPLHQRGVRGTPSLDSRHRSRVSRPPGETRTQRLWPSPTATLVPSSTIPSPYSTAVLSRGSRFLLGPGHSGIHLLVMTVETNRRNGWKRLGRQRRSHWMLSPGLSDAHLGDRRRLAVAGCYCPKAPAEFNRCFRTGANATGYLTDPRFGPGFVRPSRGVVVARSSLDWVLADCTTGGRPPRCQRLEQVRSLPTTISTEWFRSWYAGWTQLTWGRRRGTCDRGREAA